MEVKSDFTQTLKQTAFILWTIVTEENSKFEHVNFIMLASEL